MLSKTLHDAIYGQVQLLGMDDWLKLRHGDKKAILAFARDTGFPIVFIEQYFAEEAGEGWIPKGPRPIQKMPPVPEDTRLNMWPGSDSFQFGCA